MSGDDSDELDLDLDDALAAWESEFEDKAKAVSAPMPQSTDSKELPRKSRPLAPKSRPLYRPDPELQKRAAELRKKPGAKKARPLLSEDELKKKYPSFAEFEDDDDKATQIADLTEGLASTLAEVDGGMSTKPPPSSGGMDLDLDELLDDIEAEAALHDPPALSAGRRQSVPEMEAQAAIEELADEEVLDPFAHDEEIDALLFDEDVVPDPLPDTPTKPPAATKPPPVASGAIPPLAVPPLAVPPLAVPPLAARPAAPPPVGKKLKSAYRPKPPAMVPTSVDDIEIDDIQIDDVEVEETEAEVELELGGDAPIRLGQPDPLSVAPRAKKPLPPMPTPPPVIPKPVVAKPSSLPAPRASSLPPPLPSSKPPAKAPSAPPPIESEPQDELDDLDLEFGEPEFGEAADPPLVIEVPNADAEPPLDFGDETALQFGQRLDSDSQQLEIDDDEPELEIDDDEPELEIDDDEPELEIDDDEPELEIDDDEPELEVGEDGLDYGDDDDDEETTLDFPDGAAPARTSDLSALAPPASTPPTRASEAPQDHGAQTARRTVGRRKPRREQYAFVGRDFETQRNRVQLLVALSDGKEGAPAARLLTSAAEILARLGDEEEARALFVKAAEADPTDVVAVRSLRRDAMARSEWSEAASFLEAESRLPLSPYDKATALSLLAEIQLHRLGDAEAAERSARASMAADPSVATGLLLLEACRLQDRPTETFVALRQAAKQWNDPTASAVLLEIAGRTAERAGKVDAARDAYSDAHESRPEAIGALMGLARTATENEARTRWFASLAEAFDEGPIAEGFRRLAALHTKERATDALALVGTPTRPRTLRTAADAARRGGDHATAAAHLETLAGVTGATERALALVDLADARATLGDLDGADEALKAATLADEMLDTVHVVREVLARRVGDPSRLARVMDDESDRGGALNAAAKLARSESLADERRWLEQAAERGEAPIASDVLGLDCAAEAGDDEAVALALRRQADRAQPDRRLGPLLELAAMQPAAERIPLWREALAESRHLVAMRALRRALRVDAPKEAAELAIEERDNTSGDPAFHASLEAGRCLEAAGEIDLAKAAYQAATDLHPASSPATWALQALLARSNDFDGLIASYERIADARRTPAEAAEASVRAALAQIDPELSGAAFQQAHEHLEQAGVRDPVLDSLLASAPGVDAAARAGFLESRAKGTQGAVKRNALRRAADAWEQAGDARAAAAIYRGLLADKPDPMLEIALDRVELAAGEHARVSSRRFDSVKNSITPQAKTLAMEAMASLDLHERGDTSSGLLSLQSILADAPGHLPTLRALERFFMEQSRDDDLVSVERALLEHLTEVDDVVAPARMAVRLMLQRADTPGDSADPLVLATHRRFSEGQSPRGDHWLARRLFAAGLAKGDSKVQLDALRAVVGALEAAPDEQASISVPLAELTAEAEGATAGADLLNRVVQRSPDHPIAVESRARLLAAAGSRAEAGALLERAAELTKLDGQRVALLYDAGRQWEDDEQAGPALSAFERAAELDVGYADLFDRTKALLERTGEREKLSALLQKRLEAGGDGPTLVALFDARAKLAEELGDKAAAAAALKKALAIEPQRVSTLKRLAKLSLGGGDWRAAAESLIRIARLRQDRDELRWVFYTLGDIYDQHMPDPKRAEAAFRRVLKLIPDDLDALDRLAQLFEREQMHDKAIDTLQTLSNKEIDPDERRRHRLRLALAHERRGDPRSAEHVLDEARKQEPTDLDVLRAIAELYKRQGAQSALSMHLNRAVTEFRQVLQTDPGDVLAWPGLVEVLEWRERRDAARVVAAAAVGVGVQDVEISKRVDAQGSIPGAGSAAADPDLHELLAPPLLGRACFEVFRLLSEAFDKVLPFDQKAWRTERPARGSVDLREEALQVGRWFGANDVQVLLTAAAPRVCLTVGERPLTILLGKDLAAETTPEERAFLFARAIKVGTAHLTVAMRSQPEDLEYMIAGLLRVYDPNHAPKRLDARKVEDFAKRVGKAIPRKVRDGLGPLAYEMGGSVKFDATGLPEAAKQLGNRAALLALSAPTPAVNALLKAAGGDAAPTPLHKRVAELRRAPEAWDLVRFALSDAFFDARRRAGADRL